MNMFKSKNTYYGILGFISLILYLYFFINDNDQGIYCASMLGIMVAWNIACSGLLKNK